MFFKFKLLSLGAILAVAPTIIMVIIPPKTTEGFNPITLAATPDSNPPISFEEPINMLLTAETLPRMSSGVESCKMV